MKATQVQCRECCKIVKIGAIDTRTGEVLAADHMRNIGYARRLCEGSLKPGKVK